MFRHSIFTQSLMDAIFTMTLQSSSPQKTLSSPAILTQSVFLKQRNCLMEPPALPLGGTRTSLDLQDNTKWSSRRLTPLRNCLMEPPALPLGGARTSLDL